MNYSGKFDAKITGDAAGPYSNGHGHDESITHHASHAPADAIIVPDAQLLFNGDYKRTGVDLVLSKDDHELVLHDYFKGEKRAALSTPDGAHLTGDIVSALTGHVDYAQADGSASAGRVIGHVTKLVGTATAIRNGVSIILNNGDNVEKGDVVQAGSDSTLGLTFIDGTVFGLSSNAKMVLNEMVYDPNGSNNSSLLSLVAGTISFVAGETAKHGDMKVDTPVATMGIRGTAVLVEIDFTVTTGNAPPVTFQVLAEPDGHTGSYVLLDRVTLTPIATVNQAGQVISYSPGNLTIGTAPLSPEAQKLVIDVFSQKFTDLTNPITKTASAIGSSTPDTTQPKSGQGGDNSNNSNTQTVTITVKSTTTVITSAGDPNLHVDGAPLASSFNSTTAELTSQTNDITDHDAASGKINYADINAGDVPFVTIDPNVTFTYQDAKGQPVALNALQTADVKAVEVALTVTQDPNGKNTGSATWGYSVPDHAFDFLGVGETLTLTYTAIVDNGYAPNHEFTKVPFTITITGTNDIPQFATYATQLDGTITTQFDAAPIIAFKAGQGDKGGALPVDPAKPSQDSTSGSLPFVDVDLTDTHTVSAKLTGAVLTVDSNPNAAPVFDGVGQLMSLLPTPYALLNPALTASIAQDSTGTGTGTVGWSYATLPIYIADFIPNGETLTLTYTLTLEDFAAGSPNQYLSNTTTETITVTIAGDAAPAVVWVHTTTDTSPDSLWTTGKNWETGNAPTASDDAIIITNQLHGLTPGSPDLIPVYPVTIDATTSAAANSVTMNDFSSTPPELDILAGGSLTIGTTTDPRPHDLSLSADSKLHNSGTVTIVGGKMEVLDSSQLVNAGTLTLGQGGDFKGLSSITNSGTLDVTGATLNVLVGVANTGTLEATTGGQIVLNGATISNAATDPVTTVTTNGTVNVSSGSMLDLESAAITGGIITNAGTIEATSGISTISGTYGFTNNGTLETIGAELDLVNAIVTNNGSIVVDLINGASGTLDLKSVTINGGTVSTAASTDLIEATSGSNFIDGAASITNPGTIEANGGTLTINSAVSFDNGGTLQAINGSTLHLISSTVTDAASGVTSAAAGSKIDLSSASLLQHTVSTAVGGEIDTVSGTSNTINTANGQDLTGRVNNAGTLAIADDSSLTLESAAYINNTGTIALNSSGDNTYLYIDQGFAGFDGSGQVTLSDDTHNIIAATHSGQQLTNKNNTISGAGFIGQGGLVLVNNGVIDANGQSTLTLDPLSATNNGTLEATVGATLLISNTTVTNYTGSPSNPVNGTIAAIGTNSSVTSHSTVGLQNATIDGGTISISAQGALVATGGVNVISGAAGITNQAGTIEANGAELDLVNSTVTDTSSVINGHTVTGLVYVTGTGATIKLENATISGGAVDITGSDDTIESTGGVSSIDNAGTFTNAGTVAANGGALTIDFAGSFTNTGLLEAIGNSLLTLSHLTLSNDDGVVNDPVGTVTVAYGSTLDLVSASILAGTLTNAGTLDSTGTSALTGVGITNTGLIEATTGILTIDPAPFSNSGTVEANGGELDLTGETLTNTGTLQAINASTLKLTDTTVNDNDGVHGDPLGNVTVGDGSTLDLVRVTIDGGTINDGTAGGSVTSGGTLFGDIEVSGSSTIENASLNHGGVTVDATLTLDNVTVSGTIIIDNSTVELDATVTLKGGAEIKGGAITNNGTLEVAGAAELLNDTLTNTTATGSIIQIDGSQTLTLNGTEIIGGTINGAGSIDVTGASKIDGGASLGNGAVTADAQLTLDNVTVSGTIITDNSTVELDATVTLKGGAEIKGGAITNNGTLEVAGTAELLDDTLTNTTATGSIIQIDGSQTLTLNGTEIIGGTINGAGSIDVTGASKIDGGASLGNGAVTADAQLTLDNVTVSGTIITDNSTVELDATVALKGGAEIKGGAITNNGTLEVAGAAELLNDTLTNTTATGSIIQIDGSQTLTLSGTEIIGGTINGAGSIDVTGASKIDGGASLGNGAVTADAQLTLDNVTVSGTIITDNSTVELDATVTLQGGAEIKGGAITNNGTLEVAGAAELLNDTLTNTTATGSIIQIDGSQTLTLSGTEIIGGTINGAGSIDVTGASKIDGNASLGNGAVTADATLTLDNVTVSGSIITDNSTVELDATVTLKGGAEIKGGAITNNGTLEVAGAAELLNDTLTNTTATGSIIQIDGSQTLTLNGTEIIGGTINGAGSIDVTGASKIDGGASLGNGAVTADAKLTLDNVTVSGTIITDNSTVELDATVALKGSAEIKGGAITNNGTLEVAGAAELLDDTLTNTTATGSIIQIDGSQTLTLSGTEIIGGTINGAGSIDVTGASKIDGGASLGNGAVTADAQLTLDNVTVSGTIITDNSTVELDATVTLQGGAEIKGGAITNNGTLEVAGAAELLNDTLTNTTATGSIIQIDGSQTLTLSGTEIIGGTINGAGSIDVTGASKIDGNASLGNGAVTADATLTLDNVTVSGTIITDNSTVELDATVTLKGGAEIKGGAITNNGTLEVAGAAELLNDTLTNTTATGSIIQIDGSQTLTLSGTEIVGGTINDYSASLDPTSGGTIDVTGSSTIENASLNNGNLKIEQGITLTLDHVAVSGTGIEVDGANGGNNPVGNLILQDGTTISGGQVTIDSGDQLTLNGATITGATTNNHGTIDATGDSTIAAGTTVNNFSTLEATAGTLTIHDDIANTGTLTANGGKLVIDGDVSGNGGTATIGGGGTLDLGGADAQSVTFGGAGTLQLEATSNFTGTVSGLADGDIIDLVGTTVSTAVWNGTTNTLTLNGADTAFHLSSLPAGETIAFKDVAGGTELEVLAQTLTVTSTDTAGVEATPIALHFGDALTGGASLTSFVISDIPAGSVLSDGTGPGTHTVTVSGGTLDVAGWNLANLTITPTNDVDFTLSAMVTATDAHGFEYTVPATEAVTVSPAPPTVAPADVSGVEGTAIALDLGIAATDLTGDTNHLNSVTISSIPAGATLSNDAGSLSFSGGSITFTATDLANGALTGLKITPANDANFTLGVSAQQQDANGDLSTVASASELVTVNPVVPTVAPVTVAGVEGTAIALNLGVAAVDAGGDANSLYSVTIGNIPTGATLGNSAGSLSFSGGSITFSATDLANGALSGLKITPANDANFTLNVSAQQQDTNGDLSTAASATETVTVNPAPPTVTPVAVTGVEGTAIGLSLGIATTNASGDINSLYSVTISNIPTGAALSNSAGSLSVSGGSITFTATDLANGALVGLAITPANDANFTLNVSAKQQDAGSDQSTAATGTETITVNPTAPTVSWSPSSPSGTEDAGVGLTLTVTPTGASGDTNIRNSVIVTLPTGTTISDGTHTATAIESVNGDQINVTGWSWSANSLGLTVTPANGSTFTLTATASEKDAQNNISTSTIVSKSVTESAQTGYLWGTSAIPVPSSLHSFSLLSNFNAGAGIGSLLFATAPSDYNPSGPASITENVGLFDLLLLPYRSGIQQIQTSTTQLPFKYQVMTPATASGPETIATYTTSTGGVTTIDQTIVSEPAGANGSLTPVSTALEQNINGQVTSLFTSFTNANSAGTAQTSAMTSYSVAWSVYSGTNYQVQFQLFPTGGSASAVETIENLGNVSAANTAPAWQFRSAGLLSFGGASVPYASVMAVADGTHAGQEDIQFQGYNIDGSPNSGINFLITPDLTHFLAGASNLITQPSSGASLLFTPNGTPNSGFSVAWSEAVTDGNGAHSQVEFAMFKGSGALISQTTFQVPDAQNIRVGSSSVGGNSIEFLAYGDNTSTTVVEFDAGGHQIASITDMAHSSTYTDFAVMGDGRIALTYNDGSQYTTDVYDLRRSGVSVDDSGSSNGANYVAGTQRADTFIGGNNANNFYEFVGSPTATPIDSFTGGTGNSFNEALFTDPRSNFTISLNGLTATVVSNDSAHGGTLDTSNVQALAFGASSDPSPNVSGGGIEVTSGETLVMLGNFAGGNTYPITIDAGGTLEIMATGSAEAATFNGAATLQLDASQSYTGSIGGFGRSDVIDLTDVTYASDEYAVWTQTATTGGGTGTLQIYNGSGVLQSTLDLSGIFAQGQFVSSQDSSAAHGTDVNFNYISFDSGTINANTGYQSFMPQVGNAGSTLELTNGSQIEAGSWFANTPYSISAFTASFDYQASGNDPADGMAFILQDSSAGVHALGGDGSALGYGYNSDGRGGTAISPSVAVEFNVYNFSTVTPGTAFATNGAYGSYTSTGSVAFGSGDAIQAIISYDGSHLTETLTDLVNGAVYTASEAIDIASLLGSSTAYVGFSAATGGGVSSQTVSNFTYHVESPTYLVTSTADTTGAGTLRSAILYANAHPGTVITFSSSLANHTITLTSELPLITGNGTVIDGGSNHITVSGNDQYRVFFVGDSASTVSATIENLSIAHGAASGGSGASGGGGGAGLGGGIFVSAHSSLSLVNDSLTYDSASGGNGAAGVIDAGGGGGGMGGNGGIGGNNGSLGTNSGGGGGGGFGIGANGGAPYGNGFAGEFTGGTSGGSGSLSGGSGGASGGGGGGGGYTGAGGGGGVGGSSASGQAGANGGFGGGGGGSAGVSGLPAGSGGFGGGGGSDGVSGSTGGNGGFGGGGGVDGHGGFGGGNGLIASGWNDGEYGGAVSGGGGGSGMGGGVFVESGGALTISGTLTVNGDAAAGGSGASGGVNGGAFGSGIFFQSTDGSISTLTFGAGTQTVSNVIADYTGSGGTNPSGGTNAADQGGSLALVKTGGGTLTLAAVDTYTGTTTVSGGTLQVDGSISHSAVTVQSGGTLDGTGIAGAVAVQSGGTLAAGDGGAGLLTTGNLTLSSGSTFTVELGGATAGTGYDEVNVTGSVALNGAILSASLINAFAPTSGTFVIINNDGADAVSGTFAGLAEGATVALGGQSYKISYVGGDGNDVTLTVAPALAINDAVSTHEDAAVTLTSLTSNDIVYGGATATIVSVADAEHGTVALNGGNPIFTPDPGYVGPASFTYWISDAATPPAPGTFGTATNYAIGDSAFSIATADVNGDGKLDMVTANDGSASISVLLGNGDGTFQPKMSFSQSSPSYIDLVDVNGDGKADLIIANYAANQVDVRLGNGNGTFQAGTAYNVGAGPLWIAVGDMNGDGKADIAVLNNNSNSVGVMLGNGDGTFQSQLPTTGVGAASQGVFAGDFNGDGKLDLAVTSDTENDVYILLGNGNGTFTSHGTYATNARPDSATVGDLNGDGILDIVVGNITNGTVSVLLGNGDGSFKSPVSYAVGTGPASITIADVNDDGHPDLIVTNTGGYQNSPGTVSVLFGNGNGTFQTQSLYNADLGATAAVAADFNGDGRLDIAASNRFSDDLSVFLNTAPGGHLSSATVTVDVVPAIQLVNQSFLGGAGNQAATAVTYVSGHLYLTYESPVTQTASDNATVVSYATGANGATQAFSEAWNYGFLSGVAADGSHIYAVGGSHPTAGLTHDNSGGAEDKALMAIFNANGVAGSNPAPATGHTADNFFGYNGVETFQNVLATTQNGNTILYAVGSGQPASYSGYIIAEYDSSGTLLHSATDSLASFSNPGGSGANDAVEWNGAIWAVGSSNHPSLGDTVGHATVWTASYDLSSVVMHEDDIGTASGNFNSAAVLGNALYAVGSDSNDGSDYLVAKYNSDGSVAWNHSFGGTGADTLNGAVALNGHLYVVGSTTIGGNTDGVLMELSTTDGSVLSTQTFGGTGHESFSSITTDGQYLYVAGDSSSFITGGNGAGQDDAVLLTFKPGPVISTDHLTVTQNDDGTSTVTGLSVSDVDASPSDTLTVTAATAGAGSGSSVSPPTDSGTLAHLNGDLAAGITYNPGVTPPSADMITLSVADSSGQSDTVNFIFNQAGSGPNITLQGTAGKDVIFATGNADTLTGGGGLDQFVFKPTSSGTAVQHTITDFITGLDKIDLTQFTSITASNLPTEAQQGSDTLVTIDSHDSLLLKNTIVSSLHSSDFILHA